MTEETYLSFSSSFSISEMSVFSLSSLRLTAPSVSSLCVTRKSSLGAGQGHTGPKVKVTHLSALTS